MPIRTAASLWKMMRFIMTNKSPKVTYGEMMLNVAMARQRGFLDDQKPKKPKLKNVTPKEPIQLELPFEEELQ